MKRLGIVLAFVVVAGTASAARAQGYGMAGCGLGSLAFGKDNGKMMQLLASTTNGTFGTQVFGITSGTSNCVDGGVVKAQREQAAFAEVNFQDLKLNMATGGGEFLASFSTLLGCEDAAKPAFFRMTQAKYETVFASETTSPAAMLTAVKEQIKADPALASTCTVNRALARTQTGAKAAPRLALAK